ncbi:MAG: redox-sensing transcriptional repressor Rex [Gemmatimonadota bacterium]
MPPRSQKVSESAIRRLSVYLRVLDELEREAETTVSSQALANRAGTTAAQVRKDLSLFGSFGKRGLGYAVPPLRRHLRSILGLSGSWKVALIGAGRIGAALFEYPHFREQGFEIVAVVDQDPAKVGSVWNDVTIQPADQLESVLRSAGIEIVILTVPGPAAQAVADAVVASGVRGILNFAPVQLRVPDDVKVNDVNMTVELEALSFALKPDAADRRAKG